MWVYLIYSKLVKLIVCKDILHYILTMQPRATHWGMPILSAIDPESRWVWPLVCCDCPDSDDGQCNNHWDCICRSLNEGQRISQEVSNIWLGCLVSRTDTVIESNLWKLQSVTCMHINLTWIVWYAFSVSLSRGSRIIPHLGTVSTRPYTW